MSYLKLCQLVCEQNPNEKGIMQDLIYLEDCTGKVITDSVSGYPISLKCEVIDWVSEEDFLKRGKINSFISEDVSIDIPGNLKSIRQTVFEQLQSKYLSLVI